MIKQELREKIAKIVSGSRCEVCNGCGAAIITDNPDDVADRILALITESQGEPPVLSDDEIGKVAYKYNPHLKGGPLEYTRKPTADRDIAETQHDADIAWGLAQKQEGRKDVVEWIRNHQSQDITQVTFDRKSVEPCVLIRNNELEAYKKSLGITSP